MRALRILLVSGIYPPDAGGPASWVPRIGAALVERGHALRVLTLADAPRHGTEPGGYALEQIARGGSLRARTLATIGRLTTLARDADVILANGLVTEAAVASWRSGTPLVAKIVGDLAWERARHRRWFRDTIDAYQRAPKGLRLRLLDLERSVPLRQATRVMVPSRYLGAMVRGWGVAADRVRVIENAVEPLTIGPTPAPPPFGGFTLATVCRLVPWKGVEGAIRAVAGRAGVRLLVVGDGPERSALEALAHSAGASERIRFLGALPRDGVGAALAASDAFVLNSSYEGLPHVVLEAMRAERPVIASAAGGTPEVVEDGVNGLLVPVGDDAALGAAIDRLAADAPLRAALVAGGRATMAARFSVTAMVDRTEALLGEVARAG